MDLWQQRFGDDGAAVGTPERVTTGVGLRQVAFSPDGALLASCGSDSRARIWSRDGHQLVQIALGGVGSRVGFSPDGRLVFVASGLNGRIGNALTNVGNAVDAP